MQLANLIPHLDAEIERLQNARDLLALFLPFQTSGTALDAEPEIEQHCSAPPAFDKETAQATPLLVSEPEVLRVKMRRRRVAREQPRARRVKELPVVDTALRNSVPSGPIVVSAAEVLKSQASKAAQATRAAEVRRAGSELVVSTAWRDRSSDMRHVDAMLQRLINIGEEDTERAAGVRLPGLS